MKLINLSIVLCLLVSYSTVEAQEISPDSDTVSAKTANDFCFDTLCMMENISLKLDTMESQQYVCSDEVYRLIYHKSGGFLQNNVKNGISLVSISDTLIRLYLLKEEEHSWSKLDTLDLNIHGFSPADFSVAYNDYNADRIKDLYVVFYQSMSVAYSYGYLIIVGENARQLHLIKGSVDIPNLSVNNRKIESITYNHPGHETTEYKKTREYIILENELILNETRIDYIEK